MRDHDCGVFYLAQLSCHHNCWTVLNVIYDLFCIDTSRFSGSFLSNLAPRVPPKLLNIVKRYLGSLLYWYIEILGLRPLKTCTLRTVHSHSALCLRPPISLVLIHRDFRIPLPKFLFAFSPALPSASSLFFTFSVKLCHLCVSTLLITISSALSQQSIFVSFLHR